MSTITRPGLRLVPPVRLAAAETEDNSVTREAVRSATSGYDEAVYDGTPWGGAAYAGEASVSVDEEAAGSESWTTVIALSSEDTVSDCAAIIAAVARIAVMDEVSVVYSHTEPGPGRMNPFAFMAALRSALPRYSIVAVLLDPNPLRRSNDYGVLRQLLEEGALSVASVPTADPDIPARELAEQLPADRVIRLTCDATLGVREQVLFLRPGRPATEAA